MTTSHATPHAAPPAARRRFGPVTDGWILTRRTLLRWAYRPAPVVLGLLFPVMTVVMFGYLFGGAMRVPGGGGYREFLMPGMYAMTMAFGLETTFTGISTDAARGITDRFRSLPIASSAVVTGRATADMLHAALGLTVMIGCGLAIGWRWHDGAARALAAVGLLLLLRFALLWAGIYLGLVTAGPEAVIAVQVLVWPIGFLSNVFAAPATMPGWLGAVASWNPLSATVAATRHLFAGPGWADGSWPARHALPLAIAWPLLITAVFLPLSVRRYRRLDR
jgi:ABC-2 type transport system permease protein